jgi:phosphopantothenoylcysteine decarboxylase/phosphopantothenate--cysteine ligase
MLSGRHILLGVSGGIAAYKSALLVREMVKGGAEVQVVMTRAAAEFVTPLTLATLSRRRVISEMFPQGDRGGTEWTEHISLAVWADVMLVAPATAHTIGRLAHGLADDFLSTLALALRAPLAVAPAMDVDMWLNPVTQRNIETLRGRGCFVLEPEEGELASGLRGPGRLPEPDRIVRFVEEILDAERPDFRGRRILVTAGPTHEPLDPVRYLGNRSSGKMGFAVAAAAARRGAEVTLVAGPVDLETPRNVRRIDVETASQMQAAVLAAFPSADAVVMAAAVADFAPASVPDRKVKREGVGSDTHTLTLRKNPDILRDLGARKTGQILVGFALETHDDIANARAKLQRKKLDLVVLNNPTVPGAGFGTDTNVVTLVHAAGEEPLPLLPKSRVADVILDRIRALLP